MIQLAKLLGWTFHYEMYGVGYVRVVWTHPALPNWRFIYTPPIKDLTTHPPIPI